MAGVFRKSPIKRAGHKDSSNSRFNPYRYWFSRRGGVMAVKILGLLIVILFLLVAGLFAYFSKSFSALQNIYGTNQGGSIQFYDRTGRTLLWTDYGGIDRTLIPGNTMPADIRNATVAVEDKNFYHEGGVSFGGSLRALVHDVFGGSSTLQGGSTITEQLVKLDEGWNGHVTLGRKIKETLLATDASRKYSKSQILTAYLNSVPYGGPYYGIDAAAEGYFHESASDLSLAQAATLAAMPESPSYYSPLGPTFDKSALIKRRDYVLDLMRQQGYINQFQENAAKQVDVLAEFKPPKAHSGNISAPYFVTTALAELRQRFGDLTTSHGGLKVITTLNLQQQNEAKNLVADNLANVENDGGDDEALVVENVPTGQVTALVGGSDWSNPDYGQINYATTPINPGSSYKLYDYTALINDKNNVGAGSVLYDSKGALPGYPCTKKQVPGGNCLYDYDYQYPGPLTLRYALAGSRNVPAVKAMLQAGEQKTIDLSESMGLTSGYNCYSDAAKTKPTQCFASAAIGYGYLSLNESVNGYATDARLGNYIPQTFILKVVDDQGDVLYQWQKPAPEQVVKPDAAYIIDNILSDPRASYLPGSCGPANCTTPQDFGWKFQHTNGWDVAVKTGTTQADDTGLMMAMTTQYSVGSWVGYHTATKPLTPHYGGLEGVTEPLTRGMIEYLTSDTVPQNWTRPPNVKTLPAYVVNNPPTGAQGLYYGWKYPGPATDLYPSWFDTSTIAGASSCDAGAFSIDQFTHPTGANSNSASCDSSNNSPDITAAPAPASASPDIFIDGIACPSSNRCDVTITINQAGAAARGGLSLGTISVLENGQTVANEPIPPDASDPYTTTISVKYIPGSDVFSAELSENGAGGISSAPIMLSP